MCFDVSASLLSCETAFLLFFFVQIIPNFACVLHHHLLPLNIPTYFLYQPLRHLCVTNGRFLVKVESKIQIIRKLHFFNLRLLYHTILFWLQTENLAYTNHQHQPSLPTTPPTFTSSPSVQEKVLPECLFLKARARVFYTASYRYHLSAIYNLHIFGMAFLFSLRLLSERLVVRKAECMRRAQEFLRVGLCLYIF
jgi:hypothetical protein